MEYVLTAQGLCKYYKDFKALNDFSIHVPKGSIYGFVGRNGAGKTTFIRLICGLQEPTKGTYTLYGENSDSQNIRKARKHIGAVVETPSLYLSMTAEENLKQQYIILGKPDFNDIPQLLRLVGLENTGKKKAGNFSLGMRQRLGIAVALAGNPDFIVLDEPVNGLDPQGIVEIRELILKMNREMGITVLISSHILDELSRLATHFGFIDRGRTIKEISTQELENAFRKCVRVSVSDISVLTLFFDTEGLSYNVVSETEADVFAKPDISQLLHFLEQRGCQLLGFTERDESLESYFLNLVGGEYDE